MGIQKVGGEVDTFCNRCKLTLAHTILAMMDQKIIRVQCNTCQSQHAYKSGTPAAARGSSRAPRAASAKQAAPSRAVLSFEALLASKDASKARRYSPKETFAVDDVIEHPTFGYGVVGAVRMDKMDVIFKGSEKTLVHGRGPAPQAEPAQPPEAPREGGAQDAAS